MASAWASQTWSSSRTGPRAFLFEGDQELSSAQCPICLQFSRSWAPAEGQGGTKILWCPAVFRETHCGMQCVPAGSHAGTAVCHVQGRNISESQLGAQHPELLLATPRHILWVGEIISAPLGQPPSILTAGLEQRGTMEHHGCGHHCGLGGLWRGTAGLAGVGQGGQSCLMSHPSPRVADASTGGPGLPGSPG